MSDQALAMMDFVLHPSTIAAAAHMVIVAAITLRVIMRRPTTGVALAWLFLVALVPFGGAAVYLFIGERRISHQRARRLDTLRTDYERITDAAMRQGLTDVDWSSHPAEVRAIDRLGRKTVGAATVCGSRYKLFSDTQEILTAIARDVDAASKSVLMEFYIWNEGGSADVVLEALIRAAERGVSCRVLIDAVGARPWWKGKQPARLRAAGVDVRQALPVGLFRSLIGRTDLRLHRKIVVVDGAVAWTGSMNLVDPRVFKQGAGVGEWVDAMARMQGAAVVPLAATLIGDWMVETGAPLEEVVKSAGLRLVEPDGPADIQVVPSGPGQTGDGLLQMLLALIHGAQRELTLTTPYLVPDDAMILALRGAAGRGVKVTMVLPEKVDSLLTRYASRSYYDELLDLGVEIQLFRGGLLHTKSIMVDGRVCMFGTVNLDMRSLWLNYEVAMFVYDTGFAADLRALQETYIADADRLDADVWAVRSFRERFLENTFRLVSPLL